MFEPVLPARGRRASAAAVPAGQRRAARASTPRWSPAPRRRGSCPRTCPAITAWRASRLTGAPP